MDTNLKKKINVLSFISWVGHWKVGRTDNSESHSTAQSKKKKRLPYYKVYLTKP